MKVLSHGNRECWLPYERYKTHYENVEHIASRSRMYVRDVDPEARADEWNKKTIVTFSGPVEIPGQVLQPGSLCFQTCRFTIRQKHRSGV